MSPNPNPSTATPPSSNLPKNATLIFDYRDLPPDPEELAAIQAMKDFRRRTSLKSRRIRKTTSPAAPVGAGQGDLRVLERPLRLGPALERPLLHGPHPSKNREEKPDRLPDPVSVPVEPKRQKGGQPNNSNALKYGFYARRIPQRELDGLDETAVTSLKDEIDVMRVFSRKVAELGADVDDLEEATSLLRVLSLATSSINRLVRTHTRIPDPELDPAWLLKTALLELEEEWPELKAFGDKFRNKPRAESPDDETNH